MPYRNCINQDNINSAITWCSSYELMAYLSSYRTTRNLSYLEEFLTHSYDVFNHRDDVTGIGDKKPLWSQTNYTIGMPYPTLISTGMITYPIADFIKLVLIEDPLLQKITLKDNEKSLKIIAQEFLSLIEESVKAHDSQWNTNGSYRALPETQNYFLDSNGKPISSHNELPYNMYLAIGRTLIILSEVTNNKNYKKKAELMLNHFKTVISYNYKGNPFWDYWSFYPGTKEDVSHGSIDVDFLRLAFEAGLNGITRDNIVAFGNTFSDIMLVELGRVSYLVTGGEVSEDYRNAMSWMFLSPYHLNLKYIGIDASRLYTSNNEGYGVWGLAMVSEFGGRLDENSQCRLDSDCLSSICLPDENSFIYEDSSLAISYCKNPLDAGSLCGKNRDCQSGSCKKESLQKVFYTDTENENGIAFKKSLGLCL